MTAAEWGLWIASAALVVAAGKFLDDYHIKADTRSRARELLTRWFLWLDESAVPDLGGAVLRLMARARRNRTVSIAVIIIATYWAVTSAFYLARELQTLGGRPNPGPYLAYIIGWLELATGRFDWVGYMAGIVFAAVVGSWVMAILLHRASTTQSGWARGPLLLMGLIAGIAISFIGGMLLTITSPIVGIGYGRGEMVAAIAATFVPSIVGFLTLLLTATRALLRASRFVLLRVFDIASGPTVSPFAYASGLLGILILGGKVVEAAMK